MCRRSLGRETSYFDSKVQFVFRSLQSFILLLKIGTGDTMPYFPCLRDDSFPPVHMSHIMLPTADSIVETPSWYSTMIILPQAWSNEHCCDVVVIAECGEMYL